MLRHYAIICFALCSSEVIAQNSSSPTLSLTSTPYSELHSQTGETLPAVPIERLSLKNAELALQYYNRDILNARRAVEAAKADIITAGQRPNPVASVSISKLQSKMGDGSWWNKTADTIISISQLIERGNKRELRTDAAQLRIQAAQLDLYDVERQQRLGLFGAYYDLLLMQEKYKIALGNVKFYETAVHAAELRLNAGDISPTDLSRIRVDSLRAENDLQQATNDRMNAQLVLAYAIGQEGNARQIFLSDEWPAIQKAMSIEQLEQLLQQRPDVRAAEMRVQASTKVRELARSLRTRDVTVAAQYEHNPPDVNNSIGVGVSIPLFINYNFNGEIQRAEVDYQTALEDAARVRAKALAELSKNRNDLASSMERVSRYQTNLLSEARKAAKAAQFAYSQGALDVTSLLDARRTLRAIEFDAANAYADYAKALAVWQVVQTYLPTTAPDADAATQE